MNIAVDCEQESGEIWLHLCRMATSNTLYDPTKTNKGMIRSEQLDKDDRDPFRFGSLVRVLQWI